MTDTDWTAHQAAIVAPRTEAADAAILDVLTTEPMLSSELCYRLPRLSIPLVRHRLHVLERQGLVASELRGGLLVLWRVDDREETEDR